ncbi:hypothetical protein IQ266_09870 [filamentous cyanobacterium LEGE 11480]|uniref:Uncharacterized protein n=1 Tax=Romeriopsis navalis LEGE 11480 TaxID=2777977 RepID=A0A928Z2X7_9CYAN|nr:hypothetical protein [Romeriopsis navalis]MBE9030034.1 hypothetical protein [Romeriopsis navalis LEGE 11480]
MDYYDSTLLRILWGLVESHAYFLRELSDDAIILWLLRTVQDRVCITSEDSQNLRKYIAKRICLIRDIIGTSRAGLSIPVIREHLTAPSAADPMVNSIV